VRFKFFEQAFLWHFIEGIGKAQEYRIYGLTSVHSFSDHFKKF
jgi:hypothetical protein